MGFYLKNSAYITAICFNRFKLTSDPYIIVHEIVMKERFTYTSNDKLNVQ